ncbi:MAG: hypothetical protein K5871_07980 [Lachnospiraceae bacterium]|nr:hypothetical protein [Lachnospiraceae bacterium]
MSKTDKKKRNSAWPSVRGVLRYLVQAVTLLAASALIGTLLMYLAFRIPVNAELKAASETTLLEQNTSADYPLIHAWEQYFGSYRPGVFDGGSTTIIMGYSYREVSGDYLKEAMVPGYSRYWHGYVPLWRPFLYFFDYKDLEILVSFVLITLAMVIAALIYKKKTMVHTLFFCASFALSMPMIVGMCFQYAPMMLITYIGLIVYLTGCEKFSSKIPRFVSFFVIIGVLTCYMDLLTFPLYSWGVIMAWALVFDPVYRKPLHHVTRVILSGISWIIGYGGMWVMKAIVGTMILHTNLFRVIFNEMGYRAGGRNEFWIRLNAMYVNWRHYTFPVYALILLVCFLVWLIPGVLKGWKKSEKRFGFWLVMLSSPVWYFVLSNHTYIHHLFTYRIYGVMIAAALCLMAETMPGAKEKVGLPKIATVAIIALCALAALGLTCVTYEETEISNKTIANPQCMNYEADSVDISMQFVPAQNRITGLCIAAYSESTKGEYVITLENAGGVLYEEHFSMPARNSYYEIYPVDWTVEKGAAYELSMKTVDNDMPVTYYLFDGDVTMTDIGNATINGRETGSEELFGVVYYFRPYSVPRKIYILVTWFAFCALTAYAFCQKEKLKDLA